MKTRDGSEVPVQQFLQNAFLGAWEVVARTVGDLEGVIGFEVRIISPLNDISISRFGIN